MRTAVDIHGTSVDFTLDRRGQARLNGRSVGYVERYLDRWRANSDRIEAQAAHCGRPGVTERWNYSDREFSDRQDAAQWVLRHALEVAAAFPARIGLFGVAP